MSDKVYNVPAEWASRAWIDNTKYLEMYKRSVEDPNGFWGEMGKRIDWIKPYTQGQEHLLRLRERVDQMVRGRHAQRVRQLHRPPPQERAPTRSPSSGKATIRPRREDHLPAAARAGVQVRQRAEGQRRQEGRPRHHLPADDPRGGLRHAGLRAHRRRAFGGVRRLLARQPRRPHRRLRVQVHHHGRRRRARRPRHPAQEEHRRGAQEGCKGDEKVLVVRRTGNPIRLDRRSRHLAARGAGQGRRQLPARRR